MYGLICSPKYIKWHTIQNFNEKLIPKCQYNQHNLGYNIIKDTMKTSLIFQYLSLNVTQLNKTPRIYILKSEVENNNLSWAE